LVLRGWMMCPARPDLYIRSTNFVPGLIWREDGVLKHTLRGTNAAGLFRKFLLWRLLSDVFAEYRFFHNLLLWRILRSKFELTTANW